MNAVPPDDMQAELPREEVSKALMKADIKTIRFRASTARSARVARAAFSAFPIHRENLRQEKNGKGKP